uniref:TMC domain-containing protein n=1 Tax=Ditylenchus dipsaci TaxID=166011 RepID=A0A915E906_9BILA
MELNRRSSVFIDLLTVFRKNTAFGLPRRSIYHAPVPPSHSEYEVDNEGILLKLPSKKRQICSGGKPMSRQNLLNKIRQKKEVINKLRCQPWSMNRKRRTLRLAQKYLEQNESKVSKTHLYKEEIIKRWRIFLRWASNISIYFIPWESKIKKIESQFGSVVSSYFTFLRWVIFMNLMITLIIVSLVVIPEALADATSDKVRQNRTYSRKQIPPNEKVHADEIQVIWHYDGYLRYSPLFYGYYGMDDFVGDWFRYPLPLAYFLATLLVFGCSFIAILKKMALNARMSKLAGSKAEQYIFNWRVFTGWDYSIGNGETATNTAMAAVIKLRESINECQVQQNKKIQPAQVVIRIMTNMIIVGMIAFSLFAIHSAVQSSETVEKTGSLFTKNQVPSVVSIITHVFPMVFDLIGKAEKHHPKMQLRLHLIRVLTLYVINYGTLIFALFEKLDNIRDITRTFDDDIPATAPAPTNARRRTRHLRERHQHLLNNHNIVFSSRNFSSHGQLHRFFGREVSQLFGKVPASLQSQHLRAKRQIQQGSSGYIVPTRPTPTGGDVTVDGSHVTIQAQFGPVGYETRRIGPTPLPTFTPPPLPPTPELPIFRQQNYGPDWFSHRDDSTTTTTTTQMPSTSSDREEEKTQTPVITFGDVVKLDKFETQQPSPPTPTEEEFNGTSENAKISSDEQEHYNDDICWETVIGQEIVKLVTMDLYITIASIILIDFLRGYWIRYCSSWWCWDIETTFPEYGEFKVAENVLHIINNQGMIWLGLFFAPLLPAINNVKMIVVMYIRAWACLTCNVPAREIFRASRSSNFFLMILLLWLLLCTLPVGYVITSKRPSFTCGPFAGKDQFYEVITDLIEQHVSASMVEICGFSGRHHPIILLLMLIIFFLVSLVRGLREANTDLQKQLVHERTEEKKKIFELAGGGSKKQKNSNFTLPTKLQSKKPVPYLPEVEKKRREPWRLHNGTEHAPSLCPSDEPPSSPNSPTSPDSPVFKSARTKISPKDAPPSFAMAELTPGKPKHFRPSLGSLNEAENSVSDNPSTPGNELSKKSSSTNKEASMSMSKSISLARSAQSGQTDRADDWFNDNDPTHSENSFENEVRSHTEVEVHTPEELASLIVPYGSFERRGRFLPGESAVSLAAFPKDESTSPLTIIFGSGSISRRSSSKRNSFVSLYENLDDTSLASFGHSSINLAGPKPIRIGSFSKMYRHGYIGGGGQLLSDRPIQNTLIAPKHSPAITSVCLSQTRSASPGTSMSRSDTYPGPAIEAPQRMSLYAKEPRRLGQLPLAQTSLNASIDAAQPRIAAKKRTLQSQSTANSDEPSTSKFQPKELADTFVPWPSIEEVKKQRNKLFQLPPRGRSPPKMVKSEHSSRPTTSDMQPTRFRISVSPPENCSQTQAGVIMREKEDHLVVEKHQDI